MDKFWELLQESTLISGIAMIAIVGTCCYLFATGQPVPELLAYAFTSIVSLFFGAKMQKTANARRM